MTLAIASLFITGLYTLLILRFKQGWKKISEFQPDITTDTVNTRVSVIIAFKNESKNLPTLLETFKKQTYRKFEAIFIDDHSTDNSFNLIEQDLAQNPGFRLFKATGSGKKAAIAQAVALSRHDFIITTDADCSAGSRWLETIAAYFEQNNPDLIIGPVTIKSNNTFFGKLQQIEFVSLVAAGAGAAGTGMPVMCNGANLAYKKKVWFESKKDLHEHELSGDDIFLLHSIKNRKGKINFLKSAYALVSTQAAPDIKSFFRQRSRWAGKSPSYTDFETIVTALIVLGISLVQLLLLCCLPFKPEFYGILWLVIFFLKLAIDLSLLKQTNQLFKIKSITIYSLLIAIVYPFYIIVAATKGFIGSRKWK
ncbi:MAG: glycosyltransferase [Paludibacter sp.]|nr:glycosyltransferase [Paludibacter sp.]